MRSIGGGRDGTGAGGSGTGHGGSGARVIDLDDPVGGDTAFVKPQAPLEDAPRAGD
jgi:hypothetical protein